MKNRIIIGILIALALLVLPAGASDYTLPIFGNANNDDIINMQDVTYTELIILEYKDQNTFADAKYDGSIDILDVTQIELLILGKEKEITLQDMLDRIVTIPKPIERVQTISDGLVESSMIVFGVEEKLVGLGSSCIGKDYEYSYATTSDGEFTYTGGKNTAATLYPELKNLPVAAEFGTGLNYETIADLEPDMIFLISGSCMMMGCGDENTIKSIEMIENLGIPLVVLSTPDCSGADIGAVYNSINLIGGVFDKPDEAKDLTGTLEEVVELIKERTGDIPDDEKPQVMHLGLTTIRDPDGATAGMITGTNTMDSIYLEEIVNAKNVFQNPGTPPISAEQIISLDPDVMFLPTFYGYHPAREVYEGEILTDLQGMRVIQDKKVYSLPWTPCRCGDRLEFPIDLIIEAKACYPDQFSDITINDWVLDFYNRIYGVDEDMALELREAQWLDWLEEEDF